MLVEIFKAGTHKDSKGRAETYTPETLDRMASLYNSKIKDDISFEAPVVKGHPKNNEPAFGWVEGLHRKGNKLIAKLKDLSSDFLYDLKAKRFKKVSVSLYPDLMLRHIGFLGAAQPAVRGLNPLLFNEELEYYNYEIEDLDKEISEFIENEKRIKELEDRNSILESENSTKSDEINKLKKEKRVKEYNEFYSDLNSRNKNMLITPGQQEKLTEIFELAYYYEHKTGDESNFNETSSFVELIKDFFHTTYSQDIFKEFNKPNYSNKELIADFKDRNVNEDRLVLHNEAMKLLLQRPELTYEEAIMILK